MILYTYIIHKYKTNFAIFINRVLNIKDKAYISKLE